MKQQTTVIAVWNDDCYVFGHVAEAATSILNDLEDQLCNCLGAMDQG